MLLAGKLSNIWFDLANLLDFLLSLKTFWETWKLNHWQKDTNY